MDLEFNILSIWLIVGALLTLALEGILSVDIELNV